MFDLARLDLPPIVFASISRGGISREGAHGDTEATTRLLNSKEYPPHPAVLDFEESFGGLEFYEPEYDVPTLVVGPFACFSASPHWTGRERDLVPVIFSVNDVVYFLDAQGRGWTCATMAGGGTRPSADNGKALFRQAVLWRVLESRGVDVKQGRHGAEMARARGATELVGTSGQTERWWGNETALIVEIERGNGFTTPVTFSGR